MVSIYPCRGQDGGSNPLSRSKKDKLNLKGSFIVSKFIEVHADLDAARKAGKEKLVEKEILALLFGNLSNRAIDLRVTELDDTETSSIIKKMQKQLDEEIGYNVKANRTETVNKLKSQKQLLNKYLPKQLSEDEIKTILNSLEDKSIPSVMKYFKTNYNGLVDMSLVNKIARM